jgi:hypothetical protein
MLRKTATLAALTTALTIFGASEALAGVADQDVLTPTDIVAVGGMPYGSSTDGQFMFTGTFYQGAPVYEHETSGWSMYRRADGKWYVDFNAVDEDWSGTIAYGTASAQTPWETSWNGSDYVVTRTAGVYVDSHSSLTGTFTFEGETLDGEPVYDNGNGKYIYYLSSGNRWYLNDIVGETYVYAYSKTDCGTEGPWACDWGGANDTEVLGTVDVEMENGTGALDGVYSYEGENYDDEPVWEHNGKYIYTIDGNNRWYLNDILGETYVYGYSNSGCESPWTCTNWGGANEGITYMGAVVSNTSVALKTKFNTYVKVNDAGDNFSANGTSVGNRKIFELIELNTGYTLLRAHNGNFVCTDGAGGLVATSDQPDSSCYFTAYYTDTEVGFMTESGEYLGADGIKNQFITDIHLISDFDAVANKQLFTLVAQ